MASTGNEATECAEEQNASLLISAAVSIIRMERLHSGVACALAHQFVAEANNVLQAIDESLADQRLNSDHASALRISRELLESILHALPATS